MKKHITAQNVGAIKHKEEELDEVKLNIIALAVIIGFK